MTDPMAADADEWVSQAQAAVRAADEGGLEWARTVDDLAEAWLAAGNIDQAISTRRMGLAGLAKDAQPLAEALADNLGVDLMSRYQRGRNVADLREACDIAEAVFRTASASDRLRAASHFAGRWSVHGAKLPGEQTALDQAQQLITSELVAAGADDEWRSLAANTLAGILLDRWHRDGDLAALDAGLCMVTAEVTTAGGAAANVIGLLSEVAEEMSDQELLARAEELARQSLAAASAEYRSTIGRLLANALLHRAVWTGDMNALAEALRISDDAVCAAEAVADGPQLARALSMRSVLRAEFGRSQDDRSMAQAAVVDARAAFTTAVRADTERAEYANHLAMLLAQRYDLLGNSDDLDEAIALLDTVLADGAGADELATIATNQATALLSRADRDESSADLDRGIDLVEAAIKATPPDSAGLAARHDTAGRLRAYRNKPGDLATASGTPHPPSIAPCPSRLTGCST